MQTTLQAPKSANLLKPQDFWLLANDDKAFADAIVALYYLPKNYKLLAVSTKATRAAMSGPTHSTVSRRVKFIQDTGMRKETSLFSSADAVIHSDSAPGWSAKPMVLLADEVSEGIEHNEWNGFTVASGTPEAIATAALRISGGSLVA